MTMPAQAIPIEAHELAQALAALGQRAQLSGLPEVIVAQVEMARACAAREAAQRACPHTSPQRPLILGGVPFSRCPDCGWQRADPR